MRQTILTQYLSFDNENSILIYEVKLKLHGIFWFHSVAQPRDKYIHMSLPVIHNYALMLAFLGRPVESSYVSVSGKITFSIKPERIWRDYGFYVYPAKGVSLHSRNVLFSMGGTGYVGLKPKTRASIPDLTIHQVYLPGSEFLTYIIAREGIDGKLPRYVRLGTKRFGIFKVRYKLISRSAIGSNSNQVEVTHPFNVRDCPALWYHSVLRHYAGVIALSGVPVKALKAGSTVLAAPRFLAAYGD